MNRHSRMFWGYLVGSFGGLFCLPAGLIMLYAWATKGRWPDDDPGPAAVFLLLGAAATWLMVWTIRWHVRTSAPGLNWPHPIGPPAPASLSTDDRVGRRGLELREQLGGVVVFLVLGAGIVAWSAVIREDRFGPPLLRYGLAFAATVGTILAGCLAVWWLFALVKHPWLTIKWTSIVAVGGGVAIYLLVEHARWLLVTAAVAVALNLVDRHFTNQRRILAELQRIRRE